MKALKEKRVSLRSLFRRSLVILSLLALAFTVASCGGTSGDTGDTGDTNTSNGGNGPDATPDTVLPTVLSMTVLNHPINPSFEGAAPDLTGLKVLVEWSNGTDDIVEDTTRFIVSPPVAFVDSAGTHASYSPYGRYGIQYIDDYQINNKSVTRVSVYIPAVIALQTGSPGTLDGKLGIVYEDQGINAKATEGVYYKGNYMSFSASSFFGSVPDDAIYFTAGTDGFLKKLDNGALVERDEWYVDIATAKEQKKSVSSSPEAWKIDARATSVADQTATYKASAGGTGTAEDCTTKISKFYKVDRLVYIPDGGEIKKVKAISADDPTYGGNNITRTGVYGSVAETTTISEGNTLPVQKAWWDKLYRAGLKFKVIYYRVDEDAIPYNIITMKDYVKAMFTPDENGAPRATLPVFTGAPAVTGVGNASSPQHWASTEGEYNLYVSLFYYSDLIDPDSKLGEGMPKGTYLSYLNSNAALIPIATDDVHIVAQFTGFDKRRIEKTDHKGEPIIKGSEVNKDVNTNGSTGANAYLWSREDLYSQLQEYYTGIWKYDNQWDDTNLDTDVAYWYTVDGRAASPALDYSRAGLTDYDFSDIEEEESDPRTCEVTFPAPPSVSHSEDDAVEFDYFVKP